MTTKKHESKNKHSILSTECWGISDVKLFLEFAWNVQICHKPTFHRSLGSMRYKNPLGFEDLLNLSSMGGGLWKVDFLANLEISCNSKKKKKKKWYLPPHPPASEEWSVKRRFISIFKHLKQFPDKVFHHQHTQTSMKLQILLRLYNLCATSTFADLHRSYTTSVKVVQTSAQVL